MIETHSSWTELELSVSRSLELRAATATAPPDVAVRSREQGVQRRRVVVTSALIAAMAVVAVALIATTVRDSHAPGPDPTRSTGADGEVCRFDHSGPLASLSEVRTAVGPVTVCWWTNPASGDPTTDRKSNLVGRSYQPASDSQELIVALRQAELADPTCALVDSPPPAFAELYFHVASGVRTLRVPQMTCLGIFLKDETSLSAEGIDSLLQEMSRDQPDS